MHEASIPLADLPGVFIPLPGAPRLPLPIDEVRVSAGFPSPAPMLEVSPPLAEPSGDRQK